VNYLEFAKANGFALTVKVVSENPIHVKWYMGENLIFQQYGPFVESVADDAYFWFCYSFDELDKMTRSKMHRDNLAGRPHHVERGKPDGEA